MSKKYISLLVVVLIITLVVFCVIAYAIHKNSVPSSWTGIYQGTVFLSDTERKSASVEIEETDVRTVALTVRETKGDAVFLIVSNETELALEKTAKLTFTMLTHPASEDMPEGEAGYVFAELTYIDENSLEIKYGYSEAELESCEAITLSRTVE